ncbi:MAG TPA: DUF4129 domain-containing protein [Gaiellaceae bacterium]|jgi:hypothetical protein
MRAARATVIGASLAILLALVAIATQSGFGHAGSHTNANHAFVSYALTIFLVLFAVCVPIAIYLRIQQYDATDARKKRGLGRYIRGLAGIALAMVFGYFLHFVWPHLRLLGHHGTRPSQLKSPPNAAHGTLKTKPGTTQAPTFEWPVAIIAIVAVMGIVAYTLRPRSKLDPLAALPLEDDVAETIERAIDELELEPDARLAVIAAYARMEGALGRHGMARRISETPIEYLRRVLLGMTSHGDAVTRLTTLFERAKFSTHEIDAHAKQEAIAALREIREGMA